VYISELLLASLIAALTQAAMDGRDYLEFIGKVREINPEIVEIEPILVASGSVAGKASVQAAIYFTILADKT
jgi:hypothetical protein